MSPNVRAFGASVRGPRNARDGRPNQDAWLKTATSSWCLLVVCDGLGSAPQADVGAQAACRAARKAAHAWPGLASGAPVEVLPRLVELLWRAEIGARPPDKCSTTCLFALREHDGRIVLAGLGDGLGLLRQADGALLRFGGRPDSGYSDLTPALGSPHRMADWWLHVEEPGSHRRLALMTDGVSDDLLPERHGQFLEWLASLADSPRQASRTIARSLDHWPVPHHLDDKTIAVLVETPVEAA